MTASGQSAATLTVSRDPGDGRRRDIGAAAVTIGRHAPYDVRGEDTSVSRWHARTAWSGTEHIVEDLDSTNGTYANAEADLLHYDDTSLAPWAAILHSPKESSRLHADHILEKLR